MHTSTPTHFRLIAVEWITIIYTLFTTLLVLVFWNRMNNPLPLIEGRALVLGGMAIMAYLHHLRPNKYLMLLRYIFPLSLLGYWYPDTYEFCQLFSNLDYIFAAADYSLFGCQPSITFAQWLPQKLWSELFHMGYFSYYPLIALTVLAPLFTNRDQFSRITFVVLASFFLYYLIYLFLPVAGPQYYFHAVGTEVIQSGHFPQLGNYFRYHTELAPSPGPEGFFRELVESTQQSGERPTAAFPSSHVGMSTVLMMLLWRIKRSLFVCAFPFYFFLCCATVYIQAHYLVDVFGGFVTAVIFYALTNWTYTRWRTAKDGARITI